MKTHLIGNPKGIERDVLVMLDTPKESINHIADELKSTIASLEWGKMCFPFHWFEIGYFCHDDLIPLHLLIYGSVHEMRSVEHDSVFYSFSNILSIPAETFLLGEKPRQTFADIWRLRSALIEMLLAPQQFSTRYEHIAEKAIQHIVRSYGKEDVAPFSCQEKNFFTEAGQQLINSLTDEANRLTKINAL